MFFLILHGNYIEEISMTTFTDLIIFFCLSELTGRSKGNVIPFYFYGIPFMI